MNIIPAIDLYHGRCVRLYQGEFATAKVYSEDPLTLAQDYARQGAERLHIVDLNGAEVGEPQQLAMVCAIKAGAPLSVQFGGGLRQQTLIEDVLAKGLDSVVVGSFAVRNVAAMKTLLRTYGTEKIILALDVKINGEPRVATQGWQTASAMSLWSLLDEYSEFADLQVLCTDIARDGALVGPNLDLYQTCLQRYPALRLQASGGIQQLSDLRALKKMGVAAVIIGKALYEKRFSLSEALEETSPC